MEANQNWPCRHQVPWSVIAIKTPEKSWLIYSQQKVHQVARSPIVNLGSWEISHLNLFPFPHWFGCPGINCMLAPPPSTWVGSLKTSSHFPFHLLLRKSPHGVRIQWSWKRDGWKLERNYGWGFGSGWERDLLPSMLTTAPQALACTDGNDTAPPPSLSAKPSCKLRNL